jgi:hypothetical protein
MSNHEIVRAALDATTSEDAARVQRMIAEAIGAERRRPLGDKPNNGGLIKAAGGSYDYKLVENVTNMQDAVLERRAVERFGNLSAAPFVTPRDAAQELLGTLDYRQQADLLTVTFRESDPPAKRTKRLTVVFRDQGCGMTAAQVPNTIFAIGAGHKEDVPWLQGAYGIGGATTFRNAKAVVLVTRRAPELLPKGEPDEIVIAVLQWEMHYKNDGAFYLVTERWERAGDTALPYSVPSSDFPDFAPGTHLALISYGVEGYHRALHSDEKSFPMVADTRLFAPVVPYRFNDKVHAKADPRILRGLGRRLDENPRPDRTEGEALLPFHVGGKTYQLPIRFWFFGKKGDPGGRQNFVAGDHALLLTSNGQVHKHWTPRDFKYRTNLTHLFDRILVVVETDVLPIQVRTSLFTADRSDTVRNEDAIRLEDDITGVLKDWYELRDLENQLTREAITGRDANRPTRKVAEQISRALKFPGFSTGTRGTSGGGPGRPVNSPRRPRPLDLYDDPTTLQGPVQVIAETGKTKSVTFTLNAKDDFIPRRADLVVDCDHPEIATDDITIGALRGGHVRALVAVPPGVELGVFRLRVAVRGWLRTLGGLGPDLDWETKFEVTDAARPRTKPGPGPGQGNRSPAEGNQVALVWDSHENRSDWTPATVGEIDYPAAADLATEHPAEYGELAALGDKKIPTLILNDQYAPLKEYRAARAKDLDGDWLNTWTDNYAIGVGVGLLFVEQQHQQHRQHNGDPWDENTVNVTRQAVARGVLSMLPKFDSVVREANLVPDELA